MESYWHNRRILFMGPGPTSLTKELIEHFDIVVRTNGFYDMTEADQISPRCDVLMINDIYTRSKFSRQLIHDRPVQLILCYQKYIPFIRTICNADYFDKHHQSFHGYNFTKHPLLLSRFIAYIWQFSPKELFVSGVSFYSPNRSIYQPSYRNHLHQIETASHDPRQDQQFFRFITTIYPWITFDPIIGSILQIGLKVSPTIEDYVERYCKRYIDDSGGGSSAAQRVGGGVDGGGSGMA